MKILFVLNTVGKCGGTKAVFEFAKCLAKRGHQVQVVYPLVPLEDDNWNKPFYKAIPTRFGVFLKRLFVGVKQAKWVTDTGTEEDIQEMVKNGGDVEIIRLFTLRSIKNIQSDVVIATFWETAEYVNVYGNGRKFYLCQHYETWIGDKDRVNASYKLGLELIVHSGWLKRTLWEKVGVGVKHLIYHAPDHSKFFKEHGKYIDSKEIRILMPFHSQDWKGSEDGLKVFEKVHAKHSNVKLILFSMTRKDAPEGAELHFNPTDDKLRELYSSADIFLAPSWHEGFGMPPLEAMACGCPVVSTKVGVFEGCFRDGFDVLLSEPRDVDGLARDVLILIENPELRKRIAENGYRTVQGFTWDKATGELEKVISER